MSADAIRSRLRDPLARHDLLGLLDVVNGPYSITFGRGLVNHASQTLTALSELGASTEQLADFHAAYVQHTGYGCLEPRAEPSVHITDANYAEHCHTGANWSSFLPYWSARLEAHGAGPLFEQLLRSDPFALFSGAFHGVIQIGVGVKAACAQTIVEGLAYVSDVRGALRWSADSPLDLSSSSADSLSVVDMVHRLLADDAALMHFAADSNFAQRQQRVIDAKAADIAQLVRSWRCADSPADNVRELELATAACYAGAFDRGCDFFLLHGITTLWALKPIVAQLYAARPDTQNYLLRCFLFFLLVAYLAQRRPSPSFAVAPPQQLSLDEIFAAALVSRDEHLPKLVVATLECALSQPDHAHFFIAIASHTLVTVVTPNSYIF